MYYLPKQVDEKHDFAYSEAHGGEIHILKATHSGRLDYTCLGCKKPMQAILRKFHDLKPYFRHDVKDVVPGERCTFRDEEYRQKLALTIIDQEKHFYLPPIHKYPPAGVEGPIINLAPGQMLPVTRVARYQYFIEDATGNIKITSTFDETDQSQNLLFYADLALYDEDDQLIQLVTFERITKKKMPEIQAALRRLRINTIYISIPQESPEAIHRALMNGKNSKWIYNDDERQLDYLSLSAGITGGVPTIEADPGQLFEESFECRKTQIGNLIRALDKCVGTEHYRQTEQRAREANGKIGLEISRADERWAALSEQHQTRLNEQFKPEFERIEQRRSEIESAFRQLYATNEDMGGRYQSEKNLLEQKTRTVDADLRAASLAAGGPGRTLDELEDDLTRAHDRAIAGLGRTFRNAIIYVDGAAKRLAIQIKDLEGNESRLRQRMEGLPDEFGQLKEKEQQRFIEQAESEDRATAAIKSARDQEPASFAAAQRQIDADFSADYYEDEAGIPQGFDHHLSNGPLIDATEAHRHCQRLRKAKDFLGTPAFHTWLSANQR